MTNGDLQPGRVQHSTSDLDARPFAWQPLTPRGVAAFASASLRRLGFVQLLVALLVAATLQVSLRNAWLPTLREAVDRLPEAGDVHGGQLDWRGNSPALLGEGIFLSVVVDLDHSDRLGRAAHVQVELGKVDFRICSLLGCATIRYPEGWIIALNRRELEPWWGAWRPAIMGGSFLLTVLVLILNWWVLATLYWVPTWIIALYEDRELRMSESWKLAAAALLPGALLLTLAIFAYGLNFIDPIRLGLGVILHFIVGWIYLFVSPLYHVRPGGALTGKANPFSPAPR